MIYSCKSFIPKFSCIQSSTCIFLKLLLPYYYVDKIIAGSMHSQNLAVQFCEFFRASLTAISSAVVRISCYSFVITLSFFLW